MALLKFGGGVTDIRGSIGGTTFSRCAGGNYMRARTKPVNPRSPTQNARRSRVAYLSTYWSKTLTEQQRTDWRAYAAATSWTNKLGESININGLAAFLRLNALVLLYSSTVIAAAPLATGHAGGVTLAFTAENDTTKLQLAEPGGAFDKSDNDHMLMIFAGIPAEAGKLSIPKGFKYVTHLAGNLAAPQVFPFEMTAPYTMAAGQRITIKAMFKDESNRVSGPFWAQAVAAPSA
ncbi:MAG TPA: hypothetical protein VMY35_19690 [Phycisphaerae bacterium]|nr:hypothetical protein [Phycisphaerae bacterium]